MRRWLFDLAASLKCWLSGTMGIWTSNRSKGYFCVTCYSIDDKKIQKRITNFMHFRTTFRNNISEEFVRNMIAGILKHKYFKFRIGQIYKRNIWVNKWRSTRTLTISYILSAIATEESPEIQCIWLSTSCVYGSWSLYSCKNTNLVWGQRITVTLSVINEFWPPNEHESNGKIIDLDPLGGEDASIANSKETNKEY